MVNKFTSVSFFGEKKRVKKSIFEKINWSLAATGLRCHDRDNIFLRVDPDLRKLEVVRKYLPLEDKLDLEDRIEFIFFLNDLFNFSDTHVGIDVDHLDCLVWWHTS